MYTSLEFEKSYNNANSEIDLAKLAIPLVRSIDVTHWLAITRSMVIIIHLLMKHMVRARTYCI